MVEEEFGEQAEVLAIDFVCIAVDLEHGDVSAAVDLRGGRVPPEALVEMPHQHSPTLRVFKTKLAEE